MEKSFDGDWVCVNAFCPEKFQGTEQKMAEALVEALDSSRTYKDRYEQMKRSRDNAERTSKHWLEMYHKTIKEMDKLDSGKFLAEAFCELDNHAQVEFLAEAWRLSQTVWENPDRQWEAIADTLTPDGQKFVEELANRID